MRTLQHIPKDAVYCRECYYCQSGDCYYPDNLKYIQDYYTLTREPKKAPWKLNKKNNCKWFSARKQGGGKQLL